MTNDDNARFFEWMAGFAWSLYDLVVADVSFDQHRYWRGQVAFQGLCLDMQEDDFYLDVLGCLDAPL